MLVLSGAPMRRWHLIELAAEVRFKMVVRHEAAAQAHRNLSNLVQRIRTNAVPEVLIAEGRSFPKILNESSADADLVFIGMAEPSDPEAFTRYYAKLQRWIEHFPTVVLVLAAEDTPFDEVLVQEDVTIHQGSGSSHATAAIHDRRGGSSHPPATHRAREPRTKTLRRRLRTCGV